MLYRIRCPKRIFHNVAIPWFTMNHRPWVSKVDVQFNFSADIHGPKVSTRRSGREPTKKLKIRGPRKFCPWSPVSLFTYRIVFCFVLFILCSIWFRFISILGPLRRLKKIIFDVLIKWVIIFVMSHFNVGGTMMSHFLTWTCLVGAVPFLFLLFGRVELESDAATETGDSETRFWASLISSPISSVVEASVWTFQINF